MGWLDRLRTVPDRGPVTAAVVPTGSSDGGKPGKGGKGVWEVWRTLGEVHYSTTFMARQVGRLGWRVKIDGGTVDDDEAAAMLASVTGPASVSEVTAAMALHIQVAGQYVYRLVDGGGWEVTTPPERKTSKLSGRGSSTSPYTDEDASVSLLTIRRDPADPKRADSPVMAAMPVARELLLLSALARAQARNRSAQRKIVLYPAEQQWADGYNFGDSLQEALTAPLVDEYSAAAVAPMQIPVPSDLVASWTTLDLSSQFDADLPDRIDRATRRLALILDHPPEILLGTADLNHWSSWQVEESTYRAHVEPLAAWPAATLAAAIATLADVDPATVNVVADPSAMLARTPTVADTLAAFQLQLVSADYTRSILGATDNDAPEGGTPTPAPPSGGVADPDVDGVRDLPATTAGVTSSVAVATSAALSADDVDTLPDRLAAIDLALYEAGRAGSDLAVTTARGRVGAKIRTAVRNDPALSAQIDGVDNADVAATIGPAATAATINADDVVAESVADTLAGWWPDLLASTADRIADVADLPDYTIPAGLVDESTRVLVEAVTAHAVATLADTEAARAAPPVPAVRSAVAVAGGGVDPEATTAAAGSPPTLADPGGLALSRSVVEELRKVHGLSASRARWVYGSVSDREYPHPYHRRLGGRFVSADGVIVADGIPWYVGDHKGCLCSLAPAFTRSSTVEG